MWPKGNVQVGTDVDTVEEWGAFLERVVLMQKKWRLVGLASGLAVLGLFSAANADTGTVQDANDSPGSFDIAMVSHSHNERGFLTHDVEMEEAWGNSILSQGRIRLRFWTDRRRGADVVAEVHTTPDGNLYADVSGIRGSHLPAYARVWRPDDTTIRVEFPSYVLSEVRVPFAEAAYRWQAVTMELGTPGCPDDPSVADDGCRDSSPRLLHPQR